MRATGLTAGILAVALALGTAACGAGPAPSGAAPAEAPPAGAPTAEAAPAKAPQDVLAWMRGRSVPVPPQGAATLFDGAEAAGHLHALIGDARVVAIGEPAHGAHEPLALRNRLFRQLVEQAGFTVIALESGLTESRALDAYVQGGPGQAAQVAREGFTWGFGDYPENVALLQWMRDYNRSAAPERRLRIYGFDLSGGAAGGFPRASVALDRVLAYLRRVAPALARQPLQDAAPLAAAFDPAAYAALPEAGRRRMTERLQALADWLQSERTALVAAASEDDHAWALRNAWTAQRLAEALALLPADPTAAGITPEMHTAMSQRDLAMADNLQWILEREPGTARVLVFGHNAHVGAASIRGGIWSELAQPPRMLGQHLRQRLGAGYVVVPVVASRNAGGLPAAKALPGGLEETLAQVGPPAFLLDLRGAPAPAAAWLAQERPVRVNFVTETWLQPALAFDAVVYVETLHPAGGPDPAPGN